MRWPLVWRSTLEESERLLLKLNTQAHEFLRTRDREIAELLSAETQAKGLHAEVQRLNGELSAEKERAYSAECQARSSLNEVLELQGQIRELAQKHVPKPEPKRSKLTEAIRDQARQPDGVIDRRLLSYFRGEANRLMREEKMSESEVIEAIGDWQTTERSDAVTADKIIAAFNDKAL